MTGDNTPIEDPHHFEFDLDRGIREQVIEKLEKSPLLKLETGVGPNQSGIYALYYQNNLVYIGKASSGTTISKRTLRARLNEHVSKLNNVQIDMGQIRCRYLTFDSEWWVFAAEFALISHYNPEWNGSGYGSKTPGSGRPGTGKVSKFYQMFPPKTGATIPVSSETPSEE
jgi:hypothetical protein